MGDERTREVPARYVAVLERKKELGLLRASHGPRTLRRTPELERPARRCHELLSVRRGETGDSPFLEGIARSRWHEENPEDDEHDDEQPERGHQPRLEIVGEPRAPFCAVAAKERHHRMFHTFDVGRATSRGRQGQATPHQESIVAGGGGRGIKKLYRLQSTRRITAPFGLPICG